MAQILSGIFAVTYKSDVAIVVLLSLVYLDNQTNTIGADNIYRIANNGCVTITARVVEVEQIGLILLKLLLFELGVLEEVDASLVNLLHCTTQTLVGELGVVLKDNLLNLYLFALVYNKGYIYGILVNCIVGDTGVNGNVAETLLDIVIPDEVAVLLEDVVRKLSVLFELHLILQGGHLTFTDTLESPLVNLRMLCQIDVKVDTICDRLSLNIHIGKTAHCPNLVDSIGDSRSGDGDYLTLSKTCCTKQHTVIYEVCAINLDITNNVVFAGVVVNQRCIHLQRITHHLCFWCLCRKGGGAEHRHHGKNLIESLSHYLC